MGRAARNIARSSVPCPLQFHTVEVGLHNPLGFSTKPVADGGALMLVIEGSTVRDETQIARFVALVTGTVYNPKVVMGDGREGGGEDGRSDGMKE